MSITLPVSVAVHESELKADEAVEIGVVVPGGFIQAEDVPVRRDEHEAREAVEATKHDAHSTFN